MHVAGSLNTKKSRNLSIKIKTVSAQSEYNVAGSLDQNYTGRDNSIGITRGGITQSELHGAGSLNQNYTGRDHSISIA